MVLFFVGEVGLGGIFLCIDHLKNACMSNKDVSVKAYEAMLGIRTLNKPFKLGVQVSGKTAIALAMAVEYAVSSPDPANLVRKILSEEDRGKLVALASEILKSGEVEDFYAAVKEIGQV